MTRRPRRHPFHVYRFQPRHVPTDEQEALQLFRQLRAPRRESMLYLLRVSVRAQAIYDRQPDGHNTRI
jgi:hypothetical protein